MKNIILNSTLLSTISESYSSLQPDGITPKEKFQDIKCAVVDNPNLLPPDWYMLTLVDRRGIPPKATWIQVKA